MIDREARETLANALEQFLHDDMTAFELDGVMQDLHTEDDTVNEIAAWIWHFYDDVSDHKIAADKAAWDLLYRLLLLLRSDARIEVTTTRRWIPRQASALALLLFLGYCLTFPAFRELFVLAIIPFNVTAWILLRWENLYPIDSRTEAMAPFDSISQMISVRKSVPSFAKPKYPVEFRTRRIRPQWIAAFYSCVFAAMQASLFLPFLVLPEVRRQTRLVHP